MEPLEDLLIVRDIASKSNLPAAKRYVERIDKYMCSRLSLDEALNLNSDGPGKHTARTEYAKYIRNIHIREAAKHIQTDYQDTLAQKLIKEAQTIKIRIYPNWRNMDSPPEDASDLRKHLFWALKSGEPIPGERQIKRIVFGF